MLRRILFFGGLTVLSASYAAFPDALAADEPAALRVMTFNLWHGGEAGMQPLDQSVAVIRAAKADIVGLQETHGLERNGSRPDNARRIAEKLGWHYFDQGHRTGVVSRHKIVGHTPNKTGACIEVAPDRRIWLFNVHFAAAPYQPYQLLKIPYEDAPFIERADQAVDQARQARGHQVAALLEEVSSVQDEGTPIFITGDFNEPCALDWTDAVHQAARCPVAVDWPTTAAVLAAGFVDAYREVRPDPLTSPGYTWTPITAEDDPKDRHDRIDLVFVRGPVRIESAEIVGERENAADIVVTPYPSDHRGVVVTVKH